MKRFIFTVLTVTLFLFIVSTNHLTAEEIKADAAEKTATEPVVTIEGTTADAGAETKEVSKEEETGTDTTVAEVTEAASEVKEIPETVSVDTTETLKKEEPVKTAVTIQPEPVKNQPEKPVVKKQTPKKKSLWKIRGRSETIAEWKDNNTVDKDTRWRQELSVGVSRKLENGKTGFDIRGRATDDEAIDDKDARLLYFNGYYKNKKGGVELGDVAASFNPLVLSASLKGTKVNYKSGDSRKGWNASFLGGIQKSSWEDIYGPDDEEAFDRYIAGIHNENFFGTGKKITFSSAFMTDYDNSAADDSTRASVTPSESATIGTAWDWRFNRYISTRGEAAFTSSDENADDDIKDDTAGAIRIKLMTKPHKRYFKTNFKYERVETDFKPFTASASADNQKIENDSTIMLSRKAKIRITLKESRDNLDGKLDGTRRTDDGVFYLTLRPDWLKRGDFGLRHQFKRNHGRGADQRLNIHQADFNVSPKKGWKYGFSWIFTDINEKTAGMENQDIHTLRTSLGWKKRFTNDHLFRSTLRLDGNLIERDAGRQKAAGGKIDLGYDAGKFWSADISANTKKTYRDISDDSQYTAYECRGSYHPGGDRSKALRVSASKRQTFTGSDTTSTENRAKMSYLFSF